MQSYPLSSLSLVLLCCAACSSAEDPSKYRQLGPNLPPYQASLFFIISPPDAGMGCGVNGPGYVGNIGGPPKSSLGDPGMREVDGSGVAHIKCKISGNGPHNLTLTAAKGPVAFSLEGTVAGGSGTADISIAGAGTAARLAGACQLDVGRQPFQVGSGRVWAAFECPSVSNPDMPGAQCGAQGEFVFENCDP